jgi:hypothetical protein
MYDGDKEEMCGGNGEAVYYNGEEMVDADGEGWTMTRKRCMRPTERITVVCQGHHPLDRE